MTAHAAGAAEPVLELKGLGKRFGTFWANHDVNLKVYPGEVQTLCGENGAGKSTMMNMIYGLLPPTEGEILVDGRPVTLDGPRDAIDLGIGMVHQHFMLVDVFTVAENIVLGDEPLAGRGIDMASAVDRVQELSDRYGLQVDPKARVEDITVGQQQRAEILKALYRDARILILDEPTAVLTPQEIQELLTVIGQLRDEGKAIVMITHKLKEVLQVADRISVLRRGEIVDSVLNENQTEATLARMMVGRDVLLEVDKQPAAPERPVLSVSDLWVQDDREMDAVRGMTFNAHAGEIVAIAGIDGNGQSELIEAIAGMRHPRQGNVAVDGTIVNDLSAKEAGLAGVSHIPQDRHKHGLVLDFSLAENYILHDFDQPAVASNGVINQGVMVERADRLIEEFDVRTEGSDSLAKSLSGGNQQKVVIGREIERDPKLLIAAQPTRGVDIGAIEFIHKRIVDERDAGKAVLLVSLEMEEVLGLADRILVVFEGEIVLEIAAADANEQIIGLAMTGSTQVAVTDGAVSDGADQPPAGPHNGDQPYPGHPTQPDEGVDL